jgi:hypothetical protein
MTNGLVYTTIRRSNRNLMFLCTAGILLIVGLALLNQRYFYNFFYGPISIDKPALLAIGDASTPRHYWVTVDGDNAVDTGFQEVRRKNGNESVTASYIAVLFDDKVLLVKAPYNYGVNASLNVTQYTGYLETMPSDIRTRIVAETEEDMPELRGAFLPYILNTGSFRGTGYGALGFGIPLFVLCALGLTLVIKRRANPLAHPIMRGLSRFGSADAVAALIEAEMQTEHPNVGKLHLTPRWLVQSTPSRLEATRLEDVVWAYKQVTRQRGGVTYTAQIWDRHGVCISISGKEAFVNQVLEASARRAPWMVHGYTAELDQTWKKNRASVVEVVDQRRMQMTGLPA